MRLWTVDDIARADYLTVLGSVVYLRLPQLEHAMRAFQTAVKTMLPDSIEVQAIYVALKEAIHVFLEAYEKGTL